MDREIEAAGSWGLYQKRGLFILFCSSIIDCMAIMGSSFIFPDTNRRCALPGWPNDTFAIQGPAHAAAINRTIPWDKKHDRWDRCHVIESHDFNGTTTKSCDKWVYDRSVYGETLTERLNLVCGSVQLKSTTQVLLMVGFLVGSLFNGPLADFFGRIRVFLCALTLLLASGVSMAVWVNYWGQAALKFAYGIASVGVYQTSFTIAVEVVGPKHRVLSSSIMMVYYSFGYPILAGFAYVFRDWQKLTLAIFLPGALLFVTPFFLREPARWLAAKGRTPEAHDQLQHIAKVNGRSVQYSELEPLEDDDKEEKQAEDSGRHMTLLDVCRSRILLWRLINLSFCWSVCTLVYYGLSLNAASLFGSPYLNVALSGVTEFFAYITVFFALTRIGRKWPLCLSMLCGGVCCILTLFPVIYGNKSSVAEVSVVVLSMLGKFGISCAFAIVYLVTVELFPTVVRNSTMGVCSTMSRIGAIVSPYIADLSLFIETKFGPALPLIVFGVMSVLAGSTAMLLPETHNKKLPDTIEEGEHLSRNPVNEHKREL